MKLFQKYNRINIAATIGVFLLGSFLFYGLIHYIFLHDLREELVTEKMEISTYAAKYNRLPDILNTPDEHTVYKEVPGIVPLRFTKGYVLFEKESEWSTQITFPIHAGGKNYAVTVSKPLEDTEELLRVVIAVTVLLIAVMLVLNQLISRAIMSKLWRPFYEALRFMNGFQVGEKNKFTLSESGIDEFNQLNAGVREAFKRVQREFESLYNFTSAAAHEMQTPLAVIRSQLELLQQDEYLFSKHAIHIANIERSTRKLSKLHQSILLLTKIENGQFQFTEKVQIDSIVLHKLDELDDLIESKGITIHADVSQLEITFHNYLADMLIGNLINNAIKYNIQDGAISVRISNNQLTIANTSYLPQINHEDLFQQFYRSKEAKEVGNGLGLVIVKRICDAAGFKLGYSFSENTHTFIVSF